MRFKDRVTLVTGGTSGIGRATALLFARDGANVAVVGRDQERGQQVVDEIRAHGAKAVFLACDVRIPEHCRRAVEETLSILGGLDVLVNNAGVYYANTIVDCTEEEWDETLDVSLKGTFLMSKYALPYMIEKGHGAIVNIASGWGLVGGNEAVVLTKAMAVDHSAQGIRVNCVCPGDVDTPMLIDDAQRRGMAWTDYMAEAANRPMQRVGQPEEVARAILFLASDAASFITGVALAVDGGGTAD
jgi:NAD(P)-dependent dehydrogenase (short-subunit alcohol dehydrogenase family)